MPAAEPDPILVRYALLGGLVLCLPAVILLFLVAIPSLDAAALQSAAPCDVNARDAASSCLSVFPGRITSVTPHYRSLDELVIAVDGTTLDVGSDCWDLPAGACHGITFQAGSPLIVEFWRGRPVRLGPPQGQPVALTDQNPFYLIKRLAAYLVFATPGPSLLLIAALLRQAPMSVDQLIARSIPNRLEPSRRIPSQLVWRVAWGGWGPWGGVAWFVIYLAGFFFMLGEISRFRAALLIWLSAGVVAFSACGVAGSLYLSSRIRTASRAREEIPFATKLIRFGGIACLPALIAAVYYAANVRDVTKMAVLMAVMPAIGLIGGGLLLRQAPTNPTELTRAALEKWPDPPRPIHPLLVVRVALGYFSWWGWLLWPIVYFYGELGIVIETMHRPELTPLFFVATLALCLAVVTLITAGFLWYVVSHTQRRRVVVQRIKSGVGRSGTSTRIWYQRESGRSSTKILGPEWDGRLHKGASIEVMTTGSGRILWSLPPQTQS